MPTDGTDISRERLIAYLLAELPADELAALDERILRDSAFADAAESVRADLLEQYAIGNDPTRERNRIRCALNVSGESDRRVQFARALHIHLSALEPQRVSQRPHHRRPTTNMIVRWALPMAACVILAIGAWQYWPDHHSDAVLSPMNSRPAYTLLLSPDRLRGSEAPRVLRLPAGLAALQIQIIVPRDTRSAAVRLRGPAGSTGATDLPIQRLSGTSFVQLTVPSSALPPGQYRITVHTSGGQHPTAEHYWVAVARP